MKKTVSAIIDWFEKNTQYDIDLKRIGTLGFSLGGYLSPLAAHEAMAQLDFDIKKAPPMDRPLLIFHSGNDKLIPDGKKHSDYFMEWAIGEKELKFYPYGEHVCANYLDEVIPYTVDWLFKHLGR